MLNNIDLNFNQNYRDYYFITIIEQPSFLQDNNPKHAVRGTLVQSVFMYLDGQVEIKTLIQLGMFVKSLANQIEPEPQETCSCTPHFSVISEINIK